MVNNSFSFLLFFIMCVFSSRPEEPAGLFFYLFTFNRLFTFLLFYLFTFKSPFYFFTFLPFYLFTFKSPLLPNGDCRYEVRGVGFGGDVVLLLLSLVLSDDETGCARARQEGDDGGADGYYEVADECFPVDVCHFLFPFFF